MIKIVEDLIKETKANMQKSIEVTKKELASMRAGRATPALLEKIQVDYYGTPTPINQMANISVPEARLLIIQPWDKTAIANIERAIMKSDLGINPAGDGNVIRLVVPELTAERRTELVKAARKKTEEGRVAVRNIRREANDILKKEQKEGSISEDDLKRKQDEVQKITDDYIKELDTVLESKEKEILTV